MIQKIFPSITMYVFTAYALKPIVIYLTLIFRKIKIKHSYFASEIYYIRLCYNLIFIIILSYGLFDYSMQNEIKHFKIGTFIILTTPAIITDILIYFICVKPN